MTTLRYNGHGEGIPGIPAQDLSQHDIDRLINSGLFDSETDLIQSLTSRGLYRVVKPKTSKKKDDTPIETIEDETA